MDVEWENVVWNGFLNCFLYQVHRLGSTTSSATEEMGKAQVPSDPYKLNLKTQSQLTPTYKIFEYPMVKEVLELLKCLFCWKCLEVLPFLLQYELPFPGLCPIEQSLLISSFSNIGTPVLIRVLTQFIRS